MIIRRDHLIAPVALGFCFARASRLRSTRLRTDVGSADPSTRAGNGARVVPAG
jgi:hypothetical protein